MAKVDLRRFKLLLAHAPAWLQPLLALNGQGLGLFLSLCLRKGSILPMKLAMVSSLLENDGRQKYNLNSETIMRDQYKKIIESTGEDITRAGLLDTPDRAAKAFAYLTSGYEMDLKQVINDALFPSDSEEMVIVKDIELFSLCEHHLLPFIGKCHVAYIPNGKVLGLSKVARVVDMFARRLQIQEALAQQVASTIQEVTDARGVGVIVEAKHMCMMMRGVEKQNSSMKTSAMLGSFRTDQATRTEFLTLLSDH